MRRGATRKACGSRAQCDHDGTTRVPGAGFLRLHVRWRDELFRGRGAEARPRASPARRRGPHRAVRRRSRRPRSRGAPTRCAARCSAAAALPPGNCISSGHSTGGLDVRMLLTPGVQIASRRLGRAHCPPDEDGHLREHAAPRHAARQSLHHRPRPDIAAGAHRPRDVGRGTRRDSRCGEGSRARREARRLSGTQGRSARSPGRGSVAEDPVRPPRRRVDDISARSRATRAPFCSSRPRASRSSMRPWRIAPGSTTAASSRACRRRARRSRMKELLDPEYIALAFVVQTAARADGAAAPALPVPEPDQGDTAAARSRARLQGELRAPATASCRR